MFETVFYPHGSRHGSMYNPLRDIEDMQRAFFGTPDRAAFAADIRDVGNAFLIEADLPGFAKENIHVDLDGDTMTIRAERHSDYEDKEKADAYLHVERAYGVYERAFDISAVDSSSISASYENGVLKLTLPKKENKIPAARRLEIE